MTAQQPPFFLSDATIAHDAEGFRRLIGALTTSAAGVLAGADLAVTQKSGGANMSVDVAGGRVFILGTEATYQGTYWAENRGVRNVTISAADATNPRRDLIVARVRDNAYSGSSKDWDIVAVTGTPAASPVDPTVPANALSLARVAVAASATSVVNANITDLRIAQNRIGCEVYSTAAQSLPVTTWTSLTMNSELYDPLGFHSTSSNTERVVIPVGLDGIYSATGYFEDASTNSQLALRKNGTTTIRKVYNPTLDFVTWVGYLAAGDYVSLSWFAGAATHNSVPVAATTDGPWSPSLLVYKVG